MATDSPDTPGAAPEANTDVNSSVSSTAVDLPAAAGADTVRQPAADSPKRRYWRDAAAAAGVLAAVLVLAHHLRTVVAALTFYARASYMPWPVTALTAGRVVVWTVVAVCAMLGSRRYAMVGAWVAVFGEVVALAWPDRVSIGSQVFAAYPTLLALVAALLLSTSGGAERGMRVLGGGRAAGFCVAAIVAATPPMISVALGRIYPKPAEAIDGGYLALAAEGRFVGITVIAIYTLVVVIVLVSLLTMVPWVRRRVLTLFAPVGTLLIIGQVQTDAQFRDLALNPLLPRPLQEVAMVGLPLFALGAGLFTTYYLDRDASLMPAPVAQKPADPGAQP